MGDAGLPLGFASRKVPSVEVADDFGGDESARLFEAGILMAEVTVDVAAAAHEFKVVVHFSASLSRFSLSRMNVGLGLGGFDAGGEWEFTMTSPPSDRGVLYLADLHVGQAFTTSVYMVAAVGRYRTMTETGNARSRIPEFAPDRERRLAGRHRIAETGGAGTRHPRFGQ